MGSTLSWIKGSKMSLSACHNHSSHGHSNTTPSHGNSQARREEGLHPYTPLSGEHYTQEPSAVSPLNLLGQPKSLILPWLLRSAKPNLNLSPELNTALSQLILK